MKPPPAEFFEPFTPTHNLTIAATVVIGSALLYCTHRYASQRQVRTIGVVMAASMLAVEFVDRGWHYFCYGDRFVDILPLHLCGLTSFLTAFMLINHSRRLFNVVYFWGMVGGTMSVLTPDTPFRFPHLIYITFFFTHAFIVYGILLMIIEYGYRPTHRDLLRTFAVTNLYMFIILPLNYALDTNYLFLREKPYGETLFNDLGPWPWYILSLEPVALAFFYLAYLPYWVKDRAANRETVTA